MTDIADDPELSRTTLRKALSAVPTPVTVVTASDSEGPYGLVAGSFVSISLDPPLVGFFAARSSTSWPRIAQTGFFAINVLAAGQDDLCVRFSRSGGDKFTGMRWTSSELGNPLLPGAVLWIDCRLWEVKALGDHLLAVGRVIALHEGGQSEPLVFHANELHTLPPKHNEELIPPSPQACRSFEVPRVS
ncbi:flavin reductase family protein [Streptomyces sp. 5-6(2022)]|uniref:flavin reductase family protein n=1 Tax=Streptomyces sp. 5-6(2022) TaxID=2936510 RepID=UPI0023B9382D|nr:flavin reductase family protein [Streptomyces sp. 5-6(2022)]